jgi:hypothetical protein
MARETSKFLRLPALVLSVLVPTTLVALPSAAFVSGGRAYFNSPPRLVDAGTTRPNRQTSSYYEFTLRVPENAGEPLAAVKITQQSGSDLVRFDPALSQARATGRVMLSEASTQPTSSSMTAMNGCVQPSAGMTPSNPSSTTSTSQYSESVTGTTPSNSSSTTSTSGCLQSSVSQGLLQPAYQGQMQPGDVNTSSNLNTTTTNTSSNYAQVSESERLAYLGDPYVSDRMSSQSRGSQSLTLASVGGPDAFGPGEVLVQFDPPVLELR